MFAAMQAVASQGRSAAIGFANPLLYTLKATAFHDVQNPKTPWTVTDPEGDLLVSFGFDTSLTAVKGYDDSTGLGSPNGATFISAEKK